MNDYINGRSANRHPSFSLFVLFVSLVQTDPPVVEGMAGPLHTLMIAGLGMTIVDSYDTEMLAETAARLKRWEFMLVIAPLRVPGGTGSPVNPIAMF